MEQLKPVFFRSVVKIIFEKLHETAILPEKKTKDAVGYDIHACIPSYLEPIVLEPGECKAIPTGFKASFPNYVELQIRSRSGLAFKNQVFVLNSPGTIDPDYQDEIKVILMNAGKSDFTIKHGDRIAQLVPNFIITSEILEGKIEAKESDRTGGFGSTGV